MKLNERMIKMFTKRALCCELITGGIFHSGALKSLYVYIEASAALQNKFQKRRSSFFKNLPLMEDH